MLLTLAAVLAMVAALVLMSARLGFSAHSRPPDAAEVQSLLDSLSGGFDAEEIAVCASSGGAIAQDGDARIAFVIPHGAHYVARLATAEARAGLDDDLLIIHDGPSALQLDLGPQSAGWLDRVKQAAGAA